MQDAYEQLQSKERPYTMYTTEFIGTVDYIFYTPSPQIALSRILLPPLCKVLAAQDGGLPNELYASDHVSLQATFTINAPA